MANEYRGLGLNGGKYINDTAAHTGRWFAIVATEDTAISSITSNIEDLANISGITISANTAIYGDIQGITLTSGSIIAYNR